MAFMLIDTIQEKVQTLLRKNSYFQNFITIIIVFAGIMAGIQTNYLLSERYHLVFQIIDIVIISIFIIEMFVYMLYHGRRPWRYFRDAWHLFDFSIIVISLIPFFLPNSNTEFIVVFRLARVLRLARIFEKVKKFKLILNTLFRIIPSVFYVVILLVLLFYVYGVITTDLFGKTASEEFGSLFVSMKTLFFISFEGWSGLYNSVGIQSLLNSGFPEWIFVTVFISFQFIAALILLNLFIGIITSDMESIREAEKRGKSQIYSSSHTLILGWSDKIFSIIEELREANDSKEKAEIVILADMEKDEMDFLIKEKFDGFSTTLIRTRSGKIAHLDDLILVNAWKSKSIIILNDGSPSQDFHILKTIIALFNHMEDNSSFHIVAEINDQEIMNIARNIDINNRLILFDSDDFICRLIVQATFNPNISRVYSEILGFKGNEFYINEIDKSFIGLSYKDILYKYEHSCVAGILNNDNCVLNPIPEYLLQPGDKLIILAEDDSTIKITHNFKPIINYDAIINQQHIYDSHNLLIIGYSDKLPKIIDYLASYIQKESVLRIILSDENELHLLNNYIHSNQHYSIEYLNDFNVKLGNLNINIFIENHINAEILHKQLDSIKSVIVLAANHKYSNLDEIDTNTLVNLIFLREIENNSYYNFSIIAEILNNENRQIVKNKYITDFVISSDVIGPVLAQLSEEKDLKKVFDVLFQREGSEIYVRDASNYVQLHQNVNFATILESTIQRNETALGVILVQDSQINKQFILNPPKSQSFSLSEQDKIIVLAEDD